MSLIFPTRSSRSVFLFHSILAIALDMLSHHLIFLLPLNLTAESWAWLLNGLTCAWAVIWLFAAVVPRCRDMGFSSWTSCVLFLPVANIVFFVMLFVKKSAVANT